MIVIPFRETLGTAWQVGNVQLICILQLLSRLPEISLKQRRKVSRLPQSIHLILRYGMNKFSKTEMFKLLIADESNKR